MNYNERRERPYDSRATGEREREGRAYFFSSPSSCSSFYFDCKYFLFKSRFAYSTCLSHLFEREKITEAKNRARRERKYIHELNCLSGKGATLFSPLSLLSPEGERMHRIYGVCAETKKERTRRRLLCASASSSWRLYVYAKPATTIAFDKRRTRCD